MTDAAEHPQSADDTTAGTLGAPTSHLGIVSTGKFVFAAALSFLLNLEFGYLLGHQGVTPVLLVVLVLDLILTIWLTMTRRYAMAAGILVGAAAVPVSFWAFRALLFGSMNFACC